LVTRDQKLDGSGATVDPPDDEVPTFADPVVPVAPAAGADEAAGPELDGVCGSPGSGDMSGASDGATRGCRLGSPVAMPPGLVVVACPAAGRIS
jgi:hypothetical protein